MNNPWSTKLPDWEDRLQRGEHLVPDLPLFKQTADHALRVFKRLRIPDVIGQPRMGDACGEWFFPIVQAMFGSYDPELNKRMIQEFFLLIPKKNSKSSNGGAIMLTAVIVNKRPEAEYQIVAPTLNVANIAFKQAANTIKCDPALEKIFQIRNHIRTIEHRLNGTTLQIKAADTDVVTGGKQVGTLIDETHVFASKNKADDIFVELRGALAARPDGFLFQTTTQSKAPPVGVFKKELAKARLVRDGKLDLPMLPVLYEFPEKIIKDESWRKKAFWHLVNPNLGKSVEIDFLEREMMLAEVEGVEKMTLIASQHLNVEIGVGLSTDFWEGAPLWKDAKDPEQVTLDEIIRRCDVATVGIDGGGLDDLLGFCVCGRDAVTRDWLFYFKAWIQEEAWDRRKSNQDKYKEFIADGDLVWCEESTQDVEEITEIVRQLNDEGLLPDAHAIGLDPVGVAAITDALSVAGITEKQMAAVPQGYKLTGVIKGFARRLKDGRVWHDGSPMMDWVVGNAKVEMRGNAVLITKQISGVAKIDPLIAGFNAFFLMERNPEASKVGSYMDDQPMVYV